MVQNICSPPLQGTGRENGSNHVLLGCFWRTGVLSQPVDMSPLESGTVCVEVRRQREADMWRSLSLDCPRLQGTPTPRLRVARYSCATRVCSADITNNQKGRCVWPASSSSHRQKQSVRPVLFTNTHTDTEQARKMANTNTNHERTFFDGPRQTFSLWSSTAGNAISCRPA
jgi:hypothetical protein